MRFKKVDANHSKLVEALRILGFSVFSIASVGNGCPDILVGHRGKNYLFEIKDHRKVKSAKRLTPREEKFAAAWRGQVAVAETLEDVLTAIHGPPTNEGRP